MDTIEAVEQPKVWAHSRDITIRLPGNKFEPEQVIGFRVEQDKKDAFNKIFSEYLYFCASRNALVKIVNEVSDSESKEPCALTVEIDGSRAVVNQEMQRIGNTLIQNSTRFR